MRVQGPDSDAKRGLRTLLMVEEDEGLQEAFRTALQGEYRLYQVRNREEAMRLARRVKHLDAVVMDVDVTGLEFVQEIRAQKPLLRVFLLSPARDGKMAKEAFRVRVDGILSKPVNTAILRDMLASRLNRTP